MNVQQFRYSQDNLGYLVYGTRTGMAIDPGAVDDMIRFAKDKDIHIAYVTNTHSHYDHTSGNPAILNKTDALFLDHTALMNEKCIEIDGEKVHVYHTPGHTEDCVTFHIGDILITGDTLFNGTIGNCFSGNMTAFYQTIKFLMGFPLNSIIYAGHDYVKESITYARIIEPENKFLDVYEKKYNPAHVFSILEDELKANPYLRFNAPEMVDRMKQHHLKAETEFDRFNAVYEFG